ncbi:hypothetical protein CTAYLR_002819 [Chrysophaeum taylorii]|uniref:C2 domain-containing protein n=1 Tax=Chrysophaeum taylorii TaxID=2483200 RepID=A0AAD7UA19_9STRA|nr:hypothetical protein CTAYLR_002819 [Chrysophaeum taylorii]
MPAVVTAHTVFAIDAFYVYGIEVLALGEVEILVQWVFNPSRGVVATEKKTTFFLWGSIDSATEDEGDDDPDDEDPTTKEEADRKAREVKDAEERLKTQLNEIEVKSGDYQIQVHVIEARDLKAQDYGGTSDPVAYVECFGEKVSTKVHPKVLSCVFDELFIINKRGLDKEEFSEGSIRVSVMDADTVTRNDLIGSYVVDASYVYFQKNHEIYRTWVALINDQDPESQQIQGFLKLSIQVIGPGDKVYIHDEAEDREREKQEDMRADGGISGMVVMPPALRREVKWLVTTVWRAEYLPIMDVGIRGISDNKIDAFVQVDFGDIKPLRTKAKTMKGDRSKLAPEWRTELWVPVTVPTGTQTIKYTVWDYEITQPNELVATWYERFGVVDSLSGKKRAPYWTNLYGAAVETSLVSGDALKFRGKDWNKFYNTYPLHASTYRGRVLMSQRVVNREDQPDKYRIGKNAVGLNPFRRKVKKLERRFEPPTETRVLQCIAIAGSELPRFRSTALKNIGGTSKMQLAVSWGRHNTLSGSKANNNGATEWFELLSGIEEEYPSDSTQCPDVFIYLSKEGTNPCSFKRLKVCEKIPNFADAKPTWFVLTEDRGLNQLSHGEFPGAVLLQLGIGTVDEWSQYKNTWEADLKHMTHRTPYRLRCHLFQARALPSLDIDGSVDAYLQVHFNGMDPGKTEVVRESNDPTFYQTIEFDCALPRLEYAPLVFVQVRDYNFTGQDTYVGCFFADLSKDASKTKSDDKTGERRDHGDKDFPDPRWFNLMREEKDDTPGQVLASFELLPKSTPDQKLAPAKSLEPARKPAIVDIVALGCRSLVPYQQMHMQLPYCVFELEGKDCVKEIARTDPSKKPTPQNPNFLQHIKMEVEIPENAIFASPLKLTVRDIRLGGYVKPVVGTAVIRLDEKIPWSRTYKPPKKRVDEVFDVRDVDFKAATTTLAPVAEEGVAESKTTDDAAAAVPSAPSMSPGPMAQGAVAPLTESESAVTAAMTAELEYLVKKQTPRDSDDGAGVFGALLHVNQAELASSRKTMTRKKGALDRLLGIRRDEDDFEDLISQEDYEEAEPEWKKDRPILKAELEDELRETPFETYDITLGSKAGTLLRDPDFRVTGRFKGIVRVLEKDSDVEQFDLPELLKPRGYKIRLYVIRGIGLTPMDPGFMGRPGKSDPYLRVELGKTKFDDRKNYVPDATDVDLYKVVELNTELPGGSQLVVDLLDYDDIGLSDDLIGSTTIDLEDRWFLKRWRAIGKEKRCDKLGAMRFDVKPLERRGLYTKTCTAPQGTLECWVDILTPAEASTFPPDDVSLPPVLEAEIRLVVWKARDMVNMDTITNMNDLYVKAWCEDSEPQCTDIHWRAKGGKGSFNWRMKFKVNLGHNTKIMRFPYLFIQAWDQDILKWNDIIAESQVDLGRYLKKCYQKRQTIKLFKGMGGVKKVGAKNKPDPSKQAPSAVNDEENPLVPAADVPAPDVDDSLQRQRRAALEEERRQQEQAERRRRQKKKKKKKKEAEPEKKPGQCGYCWKALGACWYCCCAGRGKEVEATGADTKEAQDKEVADEDTEAFVAQFKEMTGWGDTDPKDSSWLYMDKLDHETGVREPMGRLCVSLSILPKGIADVEQAGFGRSEPNQHPYLPPPTGRLYFSLNPFIMGSQLCGPKICAQLTSCIICLGVIALAIFCQPALNALVYLFFNTF